jgi:hypothetical protein
VYFLLPLGVFFKVLGCILRTLIHFVLIWVQGEWQRSSFSLMHVTIQLSSSICWRHCLLSIVCFRLLCQRSVVFTIQTLSPLHKGF